MPRKYKSLDSLIRPHPKYGSKIATKFVNVLMSAGKRTTAQKIFDKSLATIKEKVTDKDPIDVFNLAIDNAKPRIETKSRRVGGATYQVPVPVKQKRQLRLAMKWIVNAARSKKGRPMHQKLADELILAFKGEGEAIKKREDVHKMAESNRAFAHLAY